MVTASSIKIAGYTQVMYHMPGKYRSCLVDWAREFKTFPKEDTMKQQRTGTKKKKCIYSHPAVLSTSLTHNAFHISPLHRCRVRSVTAFVIPHRVHPVRNVFFIVDQRSWLQLPVNPCLRPWSAKQAKKVTSPESASSARLNNLKNLLEMCDDDYYVSITWGWSGSVLHICSRIVGYMLMILNWDYFSRWKQISRYYKWSSPFNHYKNKK